MTHINQRRDYATNWAAANPVLQLGELGWERDTNKGKLGDGATPWNGLDYIQAEVTVTADDIGLGNVDNTSDEDKPVSTATQAALNLKANTASPAFTGNPTAPTPAPGDSDTSLATTAFVAAAIQAAASNVLLNAHPVGSLFLSTTNTNPGTFIGGTWVAWGSGRVPVGVNASDSDFNTPEKVGGTKAITIPPHSHNAANLTTGTPRQPPSSTWTTPNTGSNGVPSVPAFNQHDHNVTGTTNDSGGHTDTTLQPYITCYMWKRTL